MTQSVVQYAGEIPPNKGKVLPSKQDFTSLVIHLS